MEAEEGFIKEISYILGEFQNSVSEEEQFRKVAVKEVFWSKEHPLEKYKQEIEALVTVQSSFCCSIKTTFQHRHRNIVRLFGTLWDGENAANYLGYVMEYMEESTLHDGLPLYFKLETIFKLFITRLEEPSFIEGAFRTPLLCVGQGSSFKVGSRSEFDKTKSETIFNHFF